MGSTEPTLVRRQIGKRLAALRRDAGKTQEDVAVAGVSRTTLWRIESGRTAAKPGDVRELCALYGADAATVEALVTMARSAREKGWWEDSADDAVMAGFRFFLELEASASRIQSYDPDTVLGLMQTEEYARAVETATLTPGADAIDRFVAVRLARQRTVLDGRRPDFTAVMGPAALTRRTEPAAILQRQREHISQLAGRSHIRVRVLSPVMASHPGATGPFTIFDFDDPDDPAVVYVSTLVGAKYFEQPHEVARYRATFERLLSTSDAWEERHGNP